MNWRDRLEACPQCRGTGTVERKHFVYIVFGADDECLYVGRTSHPGEFGGRWVHHQRSNPEMTAAAVRFRMMGPYSLASANRIEIEQQLIRKPRFGVIRATRQAARIAKRLGIKVAA